MVSLSTKVTDEFKDEVAKEAQKSGKTTSDFLQLCVEEVVNGHYHIDGDRLVPTEEYLDVLLQNGRNVVNTGDSEDSISDSEFERLGFGGVLRMLREKNYPDNMINRLMVQMRDQISENGNFNSRRVKDEWA